MHGACCQGAGSSSQLVVHGSKPGSIAKRERITKKDHPDGVGGGLGTRGEGRGTWQPPGSHVGVGLPDIIKKDPMSRGHKRRSFLAANELPADDESADF